LFLNIVNVFSVQIVSRRSLILHRSVNAGVTKLDGANLALMIVRTETGLTGLYFTTNVVAKKNTEKQNLTKLN